MEDTKKDFFINSLRNIVEVNGEYGLEKVCEEDECGGLQETKDNLKNCHFNESSKNCDLCIHHCDGCCLIRSKLNNLPENCHALITTVNKCDAYNPVLPLNIIKTRDDMIDFIVKTYVFFDSVEDYENYYGFERSWNETTGDLLETVGEYYERGGEFENIPDKYPCVIHFSLENEKMDWIYIGAKEA